MNIKKDEKSIILSIALLIIIATYFYVDQSNVKQEKSISDTEIADIFSSLSSDVSSNIVATASGFKAKNDAQKIETKISAKAVKISNSVDDEEKLKINLDSYSINGESAIFTDVPSIEQIDKELVYDFDNKIKVQYQNKSDGLRQNFIIPDGPSGEVDFSVNLLMTSDFAPILLGENDIAFVNKYEETEYVTYEDLVVFDANNNKLESKFEIYPNETSNDYVVVLKAKGEDVAYPVTIDPLIAANWVITGGADSLKLGYSIGNAGDVNNDGFNDVIVGIPNDPGATNLEGKVEIYLGSAAGISTTAQITMEGGQAGAQFGFSVDGAGDVDGDGYDDVIVGAYLYDFSLDIPGVDTLAGNVDRDEGAFFIFYGSGSGIVTMGADTIIGAIDTMRLGNSVAGAGDVDNDGFDDIIVGAYTYTNTEQSQGAAYIYKGSAAGLVTTPAWSEFGDKENEYFGASVNGAGDVNGDLNDDVIVGAYGWFAGVDTLQGKAFVYHGVGAGVPTNSPSWEGQGPHRNARYGISVSSAGDVNNDGFDDIVVGADRYTSSGIDTISNVGNGGVFIYHGSATGLDFNTAFVYEGDIVASGLGLSVSNAGDVNGDGFDDVIAGAPNLSGSSILSMGGSYAFYGSAVGLTDQDWFVQSDLMGARFGFSVSGLGDVNGDGVDDVGIGSENFSGMFAGEGAAYSYFGNDPCGLMKFGDKPIFLTFPEDITVNNDPGECGAIITYDLPTFDDNCPGTILNLDAGQASGTLFPVGTTTVTYTITNSSMQDSTLSFDVTVNDISPPLPPAVCGGTTLINAGPSGVSAVVDYDIPVFTDNCSVTVSLVSGPADLSVQNLGAYDVVYKGVDPAGNESFCTLTLVILDTNNPDMSCNPIFINESKKEIIPINDANSYFESVNKVSDNLTTGGSLGASLLFKIVEGALGVDIPDWVEKLMGVGGFGVNLAFAGINFGIAPGLDMTYGTYNQIISADSAELTVNYPVKVCVSHPEAKYFGCKDTITLATSTEVLPGAKLDVDPGVLRQEMGIIARDLEVTFAISMEAYACIGIPNPTPFGPSCIGYRASYTETWNLFDPITIWAGLPNGGRFPILTTCDRLFENNASYLNIVECGADVNVPTFANIIVDVLAGVGGLDGVSYDNTKDEVTIGLPSLLTGISPVPIPEFDFSFGRLTKKDLGGTSVQGNKLVVSGTEPTFGKFRVDILSFADYAIAAATGGFTEALPPCSIGLGTTIDIGCGAITLDFADLNASLRNSLSGSFSYDPTIKLDAMDLGQEMNWQIVETGVSGFSQVIPNIIAGQMIKLEIPDGINETFLVDNLYSVSGDLNVKTDKTINLDFGIKLFQFGGNIFGGDLFTLLCQDPLLTVPGQTTNIQNFNVPIVVPNAAGSFSLSPDDIPPVVFCKDTTVYLNENGFAFLDAEIAFDAVNSFDLPIGGTGKLRILDVYPDTIFCSDYPQTTGYLVVDDDNCNIDTCAFTVFVNDAILPQMGCVDITVGIGELGTYIVNPDEVAIGITDNCRDLEVTVDPDTLFCADVGTTTDITVMVTDIAGNTNSCVASVTIIDTMALLLECPYLLAYPVTRNTIDAACVYIADNQEFRPSLLAPDCETVITYELTGATVGTGLSNVGGVAFNLGETTVIYTATDASGNSTSCSFIIIVEDTVLPQIVCPPSVVISTNEDGADDYNCTTDYIWTHPTPTDNCSIKAYDVVFTNPDGTAETVDLQDRYIAIDLMETRNFGLGITDIKYTAVDTMDNMIMCTFSVNVIDDEAPMIFCEQVTATNVFALNTNVNIEPNDVTTATINVPISMSITDMYIIEMVGTQPDMGDLSFTLTSPQGTEINLFSALCPATSDFDAPLNDSGVASITTAACGPLAGGTQLMPVEPFSTFNDEDSKGDWILTMTNTGMGECGVLTDWALQITGSDNTMGESVIELVTDVDACSYTISDTGFDPEFVDNCEGATIVHNGTTGPFTNTLNGYELPLGETIIEWIVTDPSGNADTCEIIFLVVDNIAPTFLNCPMLDVVENAEFGECQAYANVALPIAEDNCGVVDVVQVDNTGLSPGSVFPVGTTILEYEATDDAGNTARCSVRIIINDTQLGSFACPNDINAGNDAGLCSATVTGIAPLDIEDNCLDNNSIVYQIEYPMGSGIIVGSGVADASGETFEEGSSTVSYTLFNQPVLMITEVAQEIGATEGGMNPVPYTVLTTDDYLEITNIGPAAYNVSGLEVERFGTGYRDSFVIPNTTIVQPGQTLVVHFGNGTDDPGNLFFNIPCAVDILSGDPAGYAISYKGRAIDVTTTNGYNPIGQGTNAIITAADWAGSVASSNDRGGIIRTFTYDNNNSSDWIVAENCYPLTIGALNPDLDAYSSNGTITGLQSITPDSQTCSFIVTVEDTESPECKELADSDSYNGLGMLAEAGECNQSIINVPTGTVCNIQDINISLSGNITGSEDISIYIISPQNDTVALYDKVCAGDFAVDVTFDDEADDLANTLCGGDWSGVVRPQTGMLMAFYGSQLEGDWTLYVDVAEGSMATLDLTSWTLINTCMIDWEMDPVVLENDLLVCSAEYTWIHPYFFDNCGVGTISVNYFSDSIGLIVPVGGVLNNNFGKGGYEVTATFPVGTTTVEYTLVDAANNQSQCSFTVTVNDTELPVITICPNDIFIALESGECEERVFYSVEAEDNCGIASIVYTPESGSYFPAGTTPVVVIVTDFAGNESICEFNVIVGEFEPPTNQLNCNNAINLSLDQICEAVILADQILEGGSYGCFDDYCIEIETETGIPHDNYFSVGDINQTFIVSIIDCNGDSTNSCWGTVTIEEKFTPEIQCPADVTIACNQDPDLRNVFGVLLTGEAFLLNCEPGAEIIYEDNTTDFGQCAEPRMEINRTWIVTDADGNQDACTQLITIGAIDLNDIVFPADLDLDKSLECFDVNLDASLTHPDSTGHPTINELLVSNSGSLCMVSLNMTDDIFDICPGSYEILRTWKIRNMCLPISATNPIQHTQIIKVLDTTAPKMVDCPDDMTLSVDPWGCNASGLLPIPQNIYDQCSDVRFSAAVYGGGTLEISGTPQAGDLQVFASNLRLGIHKIVYRTKDDCGNTRECEFDINVVDNTPPTVIAVQNIVISITSGNTQEDGFAKLYVESLDNGSFDGCGAVKLEIRRDTDLCDIRGNTTYNSDGHPQDGSPNPNSPNYDPDGGAYVKFCCEDLTNSDLDVNEDGINDIGYVKVWLRVWDDGSNDGVFGNEGDQFNEAWAYVKVEDKLAPTITCPEDITITCADDVADLNLTGEALAFGSCGTAPVEYNDIIVNLSTCKEGFVRRRWNVVGRTDVFCDQTITLEGIDEPVSVSFAQVGDTEVSGCPDQIALGEPTWIGGPCDAIGYTLETDTFFFEDGACYKLVNTYSVINWCDYDPNDPLWIETDDFTDGIVRHIQIVKVTDDTKPVIDNCEDQMFAINDHDDSDDDGVVCEAKIVLTNSAMDPGSTNCPTGWLKWQVYVDLWGDGTDDLEFSSYLPPFDSQFNDTNSNGIPDIYVAPTSSGQTVSIPLPDIEGSMSNHKVRWIVSDGCQNNTSCESEFMVVDKKAPTPYCVDISSAVMENDGTVSIWAVDFNLGSYDNCSSEGDLRYTFTETAPEDDPLYDDASRSSSRIFDCDDVENSPIEVNMYVWDEKGNSDFCVVYFTVIDNNGTCGEGAKVAGRIATEEGEEVSGAEVSLLANLPEYPRVSLTDESGLYSFLGVANNADFEILSGLDSDYTNGVSTLDLVKIQRHILGLELMDSPYKVFAGDVNGDEKLKASDLLVLRKLILGVITEIPTNSSWRFVDKSQVFENIYSPWPVQERINIESLQGDLLNNDFVAVKIGDVNGNAVPNFVNALSPESRNLKSIQIAIDDTYVNKGEEIEVVFMANENFDLQGYQFSMELDGLSFVDISSHAITVDENNLGLINKELVTMSYNNSKKVNLTPGIEMFSMKFSVDRSANISQMIKLTNKLTVNEAYIGDDFEIRMVDLRFNESEDVQWTNKLYQNEPNPFRKRTSIGFDLVESTDVRLSILSSTGATINVIDIEGEKGYNTYQLNAEQVGVTGIYYYKLECTDYSETKKMILVR